MAACSDGPSTGAPASSTRAPASGARAAILLPDFHNPTGLVMSESMRRDLARVLTRNDCVPVIDEVLTVGGLYGIVQEIDEEDDLVVEIADGDAPAGPREAVVVAAGCRVESVSLEPVLRPA